MRFPPGHVEKYCCNIICGALKTSKVKGLRWDEMTIYGPGSHLVHVTRNIWTKFYPNIPLRFHMKFGFNSLVFLKEKKFKNVDSKWPWTNDWSRHEFIYLTICSPIFSLDIGFNLQCKHFLIQKNKRDQIWPCCKIGHGQPRVIIWTSLVVLE